MDEPERPSVWFGSPPIVSSWHLPSLGDPRRNTERNFVIFLLQAARKQSSSRLTPSITSGPLFLENKTVNNLSASLIFCPNTSCCSLELFISNKLFLLSWLCTCSGPYQVILVIIVCPCLASSPCPRLIPCSCTGPISYYCLVSCPFLVLALVLFLSHVLVLVPTLVLVLFNVLIMFLFLVMTLVLVLSHVLVLFR